MSLEDYKKAVEIRLREIYPNYTNQAIKSLMTDSEPLWQQRMKDFSPDTVAKALPTGLI